MPFHKLIHPHMTSRHTGGFGVYFYSLLNAALNGLSGQLQALSALTQRKGIPVTY